MGKTITPSISVLIPTLNSARVLGDCLKSIAGQDYPNNKVEIIVADGGSTDRTLEIAKKYKARVYKNPLKTAEAGKAVALRHAQGELVALIDSDNILPDKNWFRMMTEPFFDPEIVGSEPWEFTYRKEDGFIDRYCALLGMSDPLRHFMGDYDRLNTLTRKWTGLPIEQEDKGSWVKVTLKLPQFPTIGANGTLLWRDILVKSKLIDKYLADVDVLVELTRHKPVKFAKVKTGIVHLYCGSSIRTFMRKKKRLIRDYLYYRKVSVRKYPWEHQNKRGILRFVFSCLSAVPLFYQAIKGYLRKSDLAWFFHPLACWITLWVYGIGTILGFLRTKELSRKDWSQ